MMFNIILIGTLFVYLVKGILSIKNRKYSNWNNRYFSREPNDTV